MHKPAESRTNPNQVDLEKLIEVQNNEYYQLYDKLDKYVCDEDRMIILRANIQMIPNSKFEVSVTWFSSIYQLIGSLFVPLSLSNVASTSFDRCNLLWCAWSMRKLWNRRIDFCQFNLCLFACVGMGEVQQSSKRATKTAHNHS